MQSSFRGDFHIKSAESNKSKRETVFHRDIQTLRRELKIRRTAEYFRRVSIADETLSRVLDIYLNWRLRSKLRSKIVQIYAY